MYYYMYYAEPIYMCVVLMLCTSIYRYSHMNVRCSRSRYMHMSVRGAADIYIYIYIYMHMRVRCSRYIYTCL